MSSQQILAVLLFAVALCFANDNNYCGRRLAQTLAVLCDQSYEDVEKRHEGSMYNAILAPYYKDQESPYGWAWPPHKARAISTSRGKRLVVHECCDKSCTVDELMSYC